MKTYVLLQKGDTVLHQACWRGCSDVAAIVLTTGMPVDVKNNVS